VQRFRGRYRAFERLAAQFGNQFGGKQDLQARLLGKLVERIGERLGRNGEVIRTGLFDPCAAAELDSTTIPTAESSIARKSMTSSWPYRSWHVRRRLYGARGLASAFELKSGIRGEKPGSLFFEYRVLHAGRTY